MPSPTVSLTDPSPTEPFTSNPCLTDLVITDLTKSYAGRTVLAGIDLRAGAVLADETDPVASAPGWRWPR